MSTSKPQAMFSVTPSQLIKLIDQYTSPVNSKGEEKPMIAPLIWGPPGVGKSSIVNNIAMTRNSRLVPLILSQSDPVDIKGLPVRMDDGTVKWVASSFLPQEYVFHDVSETRYDVCFDHAIDVAVYMFNSDGDEVYRWNDSVLPNMDKLDIGETTITHSGPDWIIELESVPDITVRMNIEEKAILFLDEISTSEPAVQNAALQLVLDRRVGEYSLPHATPVVSAGNREGDGAFIQGLSHPLANRFAHITLKPNVDDFIEWGMYNNVNPIILGYVKAFPDSLSSYDPKALTNGNYGFSTPRTLTMLSEQYEPIEFFESISTETPENVKTEARHMQMAMFAGIIGEKEALRFNDYVTLMHTLPSVDDIISGKETKLNNIERSKSFGLLYSLVQNLKSYHDKYYDPVKDIEDQSVTWTQAKDNIIDFITENFSKEAGAWAAMVIFQQMKLTSKAMRSDAIMRFAQKNVDVMARVARSKR